MSCTLDSLYASSIKSLAPDRYIYFSVVFKEVKFHTKCNRKWN